MLSARGDYAPRAAIFRTAIRATDLAFFSRLNTEGRELDILSLGVLCHREVRGPDGGRALVLKTGSARELRRRAAGFSSHQGAFLAVPSTLGEGFSKFSCRGLRWPPLPSVP